MNSLFFIFSKLAWLVVSPGSFLLLLLIAGLLLLYRNKARAAKWLLTLPVVLFTLVAALPLDEWLAWPLESRFPANPPLPEEIDGIILLGGAFMTLESAAWDQVEVSAAADRNFAFLALARRYPVARLIFSGGSGLLGEQEFREAEPARRFMEELGFPASRVVFERESRNTWENALNSRELAAPAPGQNWVLVTSASHMPRSVGTFCELGWPVIPWPVDHQTTPGRLLRVEFDLANNLVSFTTAFREWLGLAAYYFTGRIPSLFPSSCRPPEGAAGGTGSVDE